MYPPGGVLSDQSIMPEKLLEAILSRVDPVVPKLLGKWNATSIWLYRYQCAYFELLVVTRIEKDMSFGSVCYFRCVWLSVRI